MKWIINLLLLAISTLSSGQSANPTSVIQPQSKAILAITKSSITNNNYYQLLNKQPADADAWLQFYLWLNKSKEEKQLLRQTLQSSQQYIAQSWQFSLMQFIASEKKDFTAIKYAIDNSDNKAMVYPYAIHYAIINNKKDLLKQYAIAFNNVSPLSPLLYEYHYNALMSADLNAKIYGKGLTDLAPMAVLQQVYGIRPDVELKYYDESVSDLSNAYICLSAGKEIIKNYPNAGYSGLLIALSTQTSIEELQKRLDEFSLKKMLTADTLTEEELPFYKNYIPSFILMYKYCKANKLADMEKWKNYLQKLGELTRSTTTIEKAIEE